MTADPSGPSISTAGPIAPADLICGHLGMVMWPHGTATYRVGACQYPGDNTGRWIGLLGTGRHEPDGDLLWWACWREDGDAEARWSSGLDFASFTEARDALLARMAPE